jgi:glutamate/tyrosine decarboxylase-like PLP-dependent enzyme
MDAVSKKHGVPRPHLHVDAAVGWVFAFFRDYETTNNLLRFGPTVVQRVRELQLKLVGFDRADSVTIDFHKLGRGHYPASLFLVRKSTDLAWLKRSKSEIPYLAESLLEDDPISFSLECTRPGLGPYGVWASLQSIDRSSWQMLTARSIELAEHLKSSLAELPYCKVLNAETPGASVLWWVFPKDIEADEIYQQALTDSLDPSILANFFETTQNLYDQRANGLDRKIDALLSFTKGFGLRSRGLAFPAWKAVFGHPMTEESDIDRLVDGIASFS